MFDDIGEPEAGLKGVYFSSSERMRVSVRMPRLVKPS